jgi:hypothetical protein
MARRPRPQLFLGRESYRRRRLIDAGRLLPFAGAFLILLPILWEPAATEGRDTAPDGIFLFLVWAGLIAGAAILAPGLVADPPPDDPEPGFEPVFEATPDRGPDASPDAGPEAGPDPAAGPAGPAAVPLRGPGG